VSVGVGDNVGDNVGVSVGDSVGVHDGVEDGVGVIVLGRTVVVDPNKNNISTMSTLSMKHISCDVEGKPQKIIKFL
jgi:hypothetical protein